MSEYQPTFIVIPARIWNLPNITIQQLRFYEKIFQFWNCGRECFINNQTLKDSTGMISDSSISDAFQYFESHGEMRRVVRNNKRYILPKSPLLVQEKEEDQPVDNSDENSTNNSQGLAPARGGSRPSEGGGLAAARHNNNNNNINNLNKSFRSSTEQQKTKDTALLKNRTTVSNGLSSTEKQNPKPSPSPVPTYSNRRERHVPPARKDPTATYIERNTMSDEYRNAVKCDPQKAANFLANLKGVKLKRHRDIVE